MLVYRVINLLAKRDEELGISSPLPNIKKHPSVRKNNESIIVIKYPNLKSNIISLKEFFEIFNFSIVQILFHVDRSTAVGIHPIKAIINKILFLSPRSGSIKLSETSIGPFIIQTINAVKGKTVIWPSDWPWTHKGIISPTQEKYIVTGWYNFNSQPNKGRMN